MSAEKIPAAYSALEAEYEVIREIGRGGTALVYLARERATGEEVAIKLIRAKYLEDDEAIARFAREARFVAQLDHPNIVPVRAVLDLETAGVALVMAHVNGRTLKQVIREEHPVPADDTERMMRGIANGLAAAHAMGIVHRDVKPENIFIDADGRALLADFGLARSMSNDTQLTMAGVAIGTPAYMAPEQIDGGQLDARGDIYSLGLVAWEMLTGHRPWEGESLYAILYHQKYEQLPDVRDIRHDVPDRLADAIVGSIEKDREARWQSIAELIGALDGLVGPKRVREISPISNDTVRFARPMTPAALPTGAPAMSLEVASRSATPVHPAPYTDSLASIAADLEAHVHAPQPKRRYALAAGAAAAVLVLAIVATKLQGRANDRALMERANAVPTAAAGDVGKSPALTAQEAPPKPIVDSAAIVAAAKDSAAKTEPAPPTPMKTADVPPSTSKPNATVTAIAPPKGPAQTPNRSVAQQTTPPPVAPPISANQAGSPSSSASDAPKSPAPFSLALAATRATVVAGGLHSCLVSADGRTFCWGSNDHGQLGTGANARATTPSLVGGDARFTSLAAGLSHSCAISRDGAAWCWGENGSGQLGDRSNTARMAPTRVADGHAFRVITAGAAHSCALDQGGAAFCWGSNSQGQLGDSSSHDTNVPAPVAGARRFVAISAGWNFTCALDGDGHAFCWGDDSSGQLGDSTTSAARHLPVPVSSGLSFVSISAGSAHACGVTKQGDAFCWGKNSSGQLGDGTTVDRSTPVRVKGTTRFASITTGGIHTCAITTDADAYCWGKNNFGQLGDGGTTDHTLPTRVAGSHAFATLRAFGSHTCGSAVSGEAFCWGYNLEGQLGDGSRTHRTRPVYIEPPTGTGGSDDHR
jgi:alpha-tubulin suppressor-like RCC1 family protein/tRNA A-37 threonylcarbamoyl transferase component Bud32